MGKPSKKAFVNHAVTHLQQHVRARGDAELQNKIAWRASAVSKAAADPKVQKLLKALRDLGEKPALECGEFGDAVSVSFAERLYNGNYKLKAHAMPAHLKKRVRYQFNGVSIGDATELRAALGLEFEKLSLQAALKQKPFALTLEQFLKHVNGLIKEVQDD